jgi:hypothetical protein
MRNSMITSASRLTTAWSSATHAPSANAAPYLGWNGSKKQTNVQAKPHVAVLTAGHLEKVKASCGHRHYPDKSELVPGSRVAHNYKTDCAD